MMNGGGPEGPPLFYDLPCAVALSLVVTLFIKSQG